MEKRICGAALAIAVFAVCGRAQSAIVINDPTAKAMPAKLAASETRLMERSDLPPERKLLVSDLCEEEYEVANSTKGAFTQPGARQTVVFYQFCQTGNGLGSVGVAILESGKVIGNYVAAEGGWTVDVRNLPDINDNGLDEIALYFSGGMHQGAGGTGVEVMEFSPAGLRSLGWFQAESFSDSGPSVGYRITARKARTPTFTRQKLTSKNDKTWRSAGRPTPFRLSKPITKFTTVSSR
jgi:hypothetical protein